MSSPLIQVGPYTIIGTLGQGALGTTHLAIARGQPGSRPVAIRILHRHLWTDLAATLVMLEEAKTGNRLNHPNIVQTLAVGRAPNGVPYMVMEYANGPSLEALFPESRTDPERVRYWCWIIAGVLDGLHHAHQSGVVHGGITASEVRVTEAGMPKVLGLEASRLRESIEDTLTKRMERRLRYAPLEVLRVGGRPSVASDVYGVAVCAWEGLTGVAMFEGLGTAALMQTRTQGLLPLVQDRATGVPQAVADAIGAALHSDPAARPTVPALANVFRSASGDTNQEQVARWLEALFPVAEDGETRLFGGTHDGRVELVPFRSARTAPTPLSTSARFELPPSIVAVRGAYAPKEVPALAPPRRPRVQRVAVVGFVAALAAAVVTAAIVVRVPSAEDTILTEARNALETGRPELAIDLVSRANPVGRAALAEAVRIDGAARHRLELDLARGEMLKGQLDRGIERVEALLREDPADPEALALLARLASAAQHRTPVATEPEARPPVE